MFLNPEQLKPEQQEKTPLELKQELGALITDLDSAINAGDIDKAETLQPEVEKRMRVLEERLRVSPEKAREILGENFYGPEEIENAFGFKIDKSKIPPIPYSRKVLEQAKKLGERLILRISHDQDDKPLTMENINEIAQTRMGKGDGKLLCDIDWCEDEDFYKNNPLKTEWKLVGGSFVENSTSKYYVDQTRILRDHLKSVDSLTFEEEVECSDEKLAEIVGIMKRDWKEAAKLLFNLQINQNHRRTPTEILYDWFLQFKKTKDRGFLENNYEWSSILCVNGYLVGIGSVTADGAGVYRWYPDNQNDNLGVVSVR